MARCSNTRGWSGNNFVLQQDGSPNDHRPIFISPRYCLTQSLASGRNPAPDEKNLHKFCRPVGECGVGRLTPGGGSVRNECPVTKQMI